MNQLAWSKIAKHQRERRCLKNKVEKRKNPFETCCLTSTYASQHTCTYIHTYVHTKYMHAYRHAQENSKDFTDETLSKEKINE